LLLLALMLLLVLLPPPCPHLQKAAVTYCLVMGPPAAGLSQVPLLMSFQLRPAGVPLTVGLSLLGL
jgi:hypothetical protein